MQMPRIVLHVLSEALSQYVENNEGCLAKFDQEDNSLHSKTELARLLLDLVDRQVANPE